MKCKLKPLRCYFCKVKDSKAKQQFLHEHVEGGMLIRFYSDKPCLLKKGEINR